MKSLEISPLLGVLMKLRVSSSFSPEERHEIRRFLRNYDIPVYFIVEIRRFLKKKDHWSGRILGFKGRVSKKISFYKIVLTISDLSQLEEAWMHEWNHYLGFNHRDIA
jgi:hypothetical protein